MSTSLASPEANALSDIQIERAQSAPFSPSGSVPEESQTPYGQRPTSERAY